MKDVIKVLVAEDNDDHRFLTINALRQVSEVDVEVSSVRDGEEALDYLNQRGNFSDASRPHLILLDLKMPKVDGFEVLQHVKQNDQLSSIPVVMVTSSESPEDVNNTYRLGGNSYVTKSAPAPGFRDGLHAAAHYWLVPASLPDPPE